MIGQELARLLGVDEVVLFDTEYTPVPGNHPVPICIAAYGLISGRWEKWWTYGEIPSAPPFPTDKSTLHVSYSANAEAGFYRACGWPVPQRNLDLFVEYRNLTNRAVPKGSSERQPARLLDALAHYGIHHTMHAEKKSMQDVAIRGGPFTDDERTGLLKYCAEDVVPLEELLIRIITEVRVKQLGPNAPRRGIGQALYRARYSGPTVSLMEFNGLPMDVDLYHRIKTQREDIAKHLIKEKDREYGVFDGLKFQDGLFRNYLAEQGLLDTWPRTGKRQLLCTNKDVMEEQAKQHPQLFDLQQLLASKRTLNEFEIPLGPDGRNRTGLLPFNTATGRNSPKASESIFGPSVWLRGLVKPAEGRAISYVDWSAEEVGIAAAFSKDPVLMQVVTSEDPYLFVAREAGMVPPRAPDLPLAEYKRTHKRQRDICKVALLGMNYGMGVRSLAAGTGLSMLEAERLHYQLKRMFDGFQQWSRKVVTNGYLTREITTFFGWRAEVTGGTKPATLLNYPAQAHGAEMLRLACCLIAEAGIQLCFPVHDAVVVESALGEIEEVTAATQACMAEASRIVLNGFVINTDAEIIRFPDRYMDARGKGMWRTAMEVLGESY